MKNKEELQNEFNNKLDQLRNEFNQQIKELECKPKFEVGRWYKVHGKNYGHGLYCITKLLKNKLSGNNNMSYGFKNDDGQWLENDIRCTDDFTAATDKEVEDALVKEAVNRGFKEGVNYKYLDVNGDQTDNKIRVCGNNWSYETDSLWNGWGFIYSKGKWAEIIQEEKIEIGGYSVEFDKTAKDGIWYSTVIDGFGFTAQFWQAAKIVAEHNKAGVRVGCSKQFEVSLETINKIINQIK